MLLYIYNRVEFKCTSKYDYMKLCINILVIYIYIPGQSLSRIIFDFCGFSDAGLKITFGLRVMDSMTQFWCQKVGLSHHFASYVWSFQMWLTEGKNQQLFDFWSLTTFQSRPKKRCSFWMSRYALYVSTCYISHNIPSGNLLHSYWKWWFIVDFPIKNGDFP